MRITAATVEEIAHQARTGRIVFVDTETTGLGADDEICQIAALEYVGGRPGRSLALYLKPTCGMNPGAQRVHGLSLEFLASHGLEPAQGMRRFVEFLGEDALFVAHNVPFDRGMIERECRRFGVALDWSGRQTCDTLALARRLRPGLGCYALGRLLESLGVDGVNSHDALDDVRACAGVFFCLIGGGEKCD